MTYDLRLGSCLDPVTGLASLADKSVDALVTDPPAGIGFMGKAWDSDKGGRSQWISWLTQVARECLRVLKPGAHGLVWALPRTSHWTATALEDAGFEIRDVHHHIFGTGFPKSLTSKSAAIPDDAGTALKPAVEHWILVRKPLDGTVSENFAKHGTGVLNIGACRVEGVPEAPGSTPPTANGNRQTYGAMIRTEYVVPDGRWPAHLSLDEYAAGVLDEQSGERASGGYPPEGGLRTKNVYEGARHERGPAAFGGTSGGASRFFFVAKASRAEKDAGLDSFARKSGGEATGRVDGSAGTKNPRAGAGRTGRVRNSHPTVKSVALMRWLVRLVAQPGALVLDAFAGSGTTGVACAEEGVRFVGFELEPEYFEIAQARIAQANRQQKLFAPPALNGDEAKPRPGQPSLFDALEVRGDR